MTDDQGAERIETLEAMVAGLFLAVEGLAEELHNLAPEAIQTRIRAARLHLQDLRQGRADSRGTIGDRALEIHLALLDRAVLATAEGHCSEP